MCWRAVPSNRTVVSCPAAKTLAATRTTSMTSGNSPLGKVVVAKAVSTSWRGWWRRSSMYRLNRLYSHSSGLWAISSLVLPTALLSGRRARAARNSSCSASGTPRRSAMTNSVKGLQ